MPCRGFDNSHAVKIISRAENVEPEIQKSRLRLGLCPTCGIQTQTYDKDGKYQPVTNSDVFESRCLLCNPLMIHPRVQKSYSDRVVTDSSCSDNSTHSYDAYRSNKHTPRKRVEKKREQGRRKRSNSNKSKPKMKPQDVYNLSEEVFFTGSTCASPVLTHVESESSIEILGQQYNEKLNRSMIRRKLNDSCLKKNSRQVPHTCLQGENMQYSVEKSVYGYCYHNTLGKASVGCTSIPDSIFLSPSLKVSKSNSQDKYSKRCSYRQKCRQEFSSGSDIPQHFRRNHVSFSQIVSSIAPHTLRSFHTKKGATWSSGCAAL